MQNFFTRLYILLAVFSIYSCEQQDELSRDEVMKIIGEFDKGWLNKDTTVVNRVLSPEYVYFTQSGGIFNRRNIIYTAYSPEYKLSEMERSDYSIRIRGNTAVVSTTWKGIGMYRGKPFDDYQRCSVTIVKLKGKVEILSEHCTPLKRVNL